MEERLTGGTSEPLVYRDGPAAGRDGRRGSIPFIPDHIMTEFAVGLFFAGALFYLAAYLPRGLGEPANRFLTPEHIKPEWYFLWMYELLKRVPKLIGILVPPLALIVLFLVPWLDRSSQRYPVRRPIASGVMALAVAAVVALTILGL